MKSRAAASVERCADELYGRLCKAVEVQGRIRVEDLISTTASIVGEATIAAAGDFDPRQHKMAPGAWVFSDNVNRLICGDRALAEAPADSIAGLLRDRLLHCGFNPKDFPVLEDVYRHFAAHVGDKADWGKVPLSVPQANLPSLMPLQAAYQTRALVDEVLAPLGGDRTQRLTATTLTLAQVLCRTKAAIVSWIATTLALETVNGMAKMAPMTEQVMARLIEEQQTKTR